MAYEMYELEVYAKSIKKLDEQIAIAISDLSYMQNHRENLVKEMVNFITGDKNE